MRKTVLPLVLLSLSLPAVSLARVGESEPQIEARYGKPISQNPPTENGRSVFYRASGMDIMVIYLNWRSVSEGYTAINKEEGLSATVLQALLDANSAGDKWKEVRSSVIGSRTWAIGERLYAYTDGVSPVRALNVASFPYMKSVIEKSNNAEKERVQGF